MNYANHPGAQQLRAMSFIYETTKERGATILLPTSMVDSLNRAVAFAVAAGDVSGKDLPGQEAAPKKLNGPIPQPSGPREQDARFCVELAGPCKTEPEKIRSGGRGRG